MIFKKIRTDNNHYIYDTYSNNIFKIEKRIYDNINKDPQIIEELFPDVKSYKGLEKIDVRENKESIKCILDNKVERLALFVSNCCNLNCSYCFYSDTYENAKNLSVGFMDFFIAKKAIDFYFSHSKNKENKKYSVSFYGGEPLLNFDLIKECTKYIQNQYKELFNETILVISTNLTILNDNIIKFFVNNDFHLAVSLDGPIDLHDRYRKDKSGNGSFEKVLENLTKIFKYNEKYFYNNIYFNVVAAPPIDFKKIYNFFKCDKVLKKSNFAQIGTISLTGDPCFKKLFGFDVFDGIETEKDLFEVYKNKTIKFDLCMDDPFLEKLYNEMFWTIHNRRMSDLPMKIKEKNSCIPGKTRLMVNYDGFLFPCERGGYFEIGDVDNGFDYEKIYKLMNDFTSIRNNICKGCWAIRFCKNCFLTASKGYIIDEKSFVKHCEHTKVVLKEYLRRYIEIMEINNNAFSPFRKVIKWEEYFLL